MVPYIMEYKHIGSYEFIVIILYFDMLLKKSQNFKIAIDYNPFEPINEDIRNYGI